ncbi:MAG: FIST signal transduction protein, partial [Burkholderiales bacterium]
MTLSVTTITSQQDSTQAGAELGRTIREGLNGGSADAVVVFASAQHDYQRLLSALVETSGTEVVVGSSSAGEFTNSSRGEGYVSALGLRSESMQFAVGIGRNLTANPTAAARQVVETFAGLAGRPMPYRSALVMTDALAGHTDALVEEMTIATGGNYRFFGGGAGDDGRFQKTYVFAGTQAMSDAVVALEMLSMQPVGVGVSHGWTPGGPGLRVTEVDGSRLISLNGAPALQAFEDYAEATRQKLDQEYPLPFFLHNILGIESNGSFRLRVPLGIGADGSVSCAAAIPRGAVVRIMKTTAESAVLAAEQATRSALEALGGREPGAALVFDCVATRLRIGSAFDNELKACADLLGPAGFVGCNTYGQIARAEGQFGGFHNCTAVV